MRPTSAFISGMATMGVLAGGIVLGTGILDGTTSDQNAASNSGSNSGGGSKSGTSNSGSTSGGSSASTVTDGTFDGPVVQTQYGPMQVEIVIKGGKIESATTLQHPGGDGTSDQINAQVVPILTKATVDYQSVKFGNVSRATISTESYKQSAQAALDKAGYTG
jgi:uncharacterized protein with FMN-binding domain